MLTGRILVLGQQVAGDDGVGPQVLRALAGRRAGVELIELGDPTELVEYLATPLPVVIVDAAVDAGPPGTVSTVDPERLDARAPMSVSSHGVGVAQAIQLARTLHGPAVSPRIRIVVVGIDPPRRYVEALSRAVRDAVPAAADAALGALGGSPRA